jgi:hydrogenase nickel incorporation protein HypB
MCATCGCGDPDGVRITDPDRARHDHHDHPHDHGHDHDHVHQDGRSSTVTISLEQRVLAKNDRLADDNRRWLAERDVIAVNLMSSPGAGKTTLLERTVVELGDDMPVSVIEGDQETLFDAERIRATGCRAVQVNTGSGCHLDAEMLAGALRTLDPPSRSVVLVENVGNLVCPALFDLGERSRVVITSVTEGADKPLKYPHMFRSADLVVLNKVDLLPYVDFDLDRFAAALRTVCPSATVLHTSVTRGDGMAEWVAWLRCVFVTGSGVPSSSS